MEYKEVLMIVATNLGNIYKNVFNTELLSWRKLIMSVVFSTVLGTILVLYVQENHLSLWLAFVLAVFLGMVTNQSKIATLLGAVPANLYLAFPSVPVAKSSQ